MDSRIQAVAIVGAAGLLIFVLEMVRRRRLLERYALVWLFCAAILLGLAIWRDGLARLASAVGIAYPPNALFFVALAFVLVLLLHFSAAVSRLADQSKVLAQRLALLEERLRHYEQDGPRGTVHHTDAADDDPEIEPVGAPRAPGR
jgi:hypothetical protein